MRLGICLSAATNAAAIAASTLDYVEDNAQKLLLPNASDADAAAAAQAARVAGKPIEIVCCFLPAALHCTGPQADHAAITAYATILFRRAALIGIDTVVFGSGAARRVPDGFPLAQALDQFSALLAALAPLAQRHGLVIALEPLRPGECNLITTLDTGAMIVRRCAHPAVRLLADIYHMRHAGDPPEALLRHADLLHHVHLAEHTDRTAPGIAGDDFRPYLRALRACGYDRRLSLECRMPDPTSGLAPALAEVRRQLHDA